MIVGLRGTVEAVTGDAALIAVGGIVVKVLATRRALERCGVPGSEVSLQTYLHVREDGLALFGFADEAERELFQKLLAVTGVGPPRAGVGPPRAVALLSALAPERLIDAVRREDLGPLAGVSGIGKKIAARIVLELKGKLGEIAAATALPAASNGLFAELQEALAPLGYSAAEIQGALGTLNAEALVDRDAAFRATLLYLDERRRGGGR
jgi:Holliday junction DNA helicase RuvA